MLKKRDFTLETDSVPARAARPGRRRHFAATFLLGLTLLAGLAPLAAQGGPPPAVRDAVSSVVDMLESSGEASLRTFIDERLSDSFRARMTDDELIAHLGSLRQAARGKTDELAVEKTPQGLELIFAAGFALAADVDEESGGIRRLDRVGGESAASAEARPEVVEGAVTGHVRALEALGRGGDKSRAALVDDHFTPALRERLAGDQLDELLAKIQRAAAAAGTVKIEAVGQGYRLSLRGGSDLDVLFSVDPEPPFGIRELSVSSDIAPSPEVDVAPLTWETLDARLRALEEEGFAGTILAIRDGETVLHESYGLADRSEGRRVTPDTIFDIGSVPIDFTRAAIFLLMQRGQLTLDTRVGDLFPQAPPDKRDITVEHLLSGRSGLPNFHHVVGEDADADLTWIDRDEAERRILAQELLFAPGEDRSHSHSAFGLLAAAVERISGKSYRDFLVDNFFEPAGMTRTGFYGDPRNPDEFAVGYGGNPAGLVNVPPYWGPTSWLIMGSGGMYSTPGDMHRFFDTLLSGEILRGDARELYIDRRVAMGGTDRGFRFVHAWDGDETMAYLATSTGRENPEISALPRLVAGLVLP